METSGGNLYECYLFGSGGSASERIESKSQASAIELCRHILAARPHYSAFELWQSRRRIYSEGRQPVTLVAMPFLEFGPASAPGFGRARRRQP